MGIISIILTFISIGIWTQSSLLGILATIPGICCGLIAVNKADAFAKIGLFTATATMILMFIAPMYVGE